ncbi:DUF7684 family protein [Dyadobacter crusticola]|uniref:DUF7684 family protein n=1 Tax=Dyadobacter crusticola TaxID=292407 RepID=UPI0004E1ED6C|nr:hypothetical protein [Dyadobacter crusticola]
MIPDFFLYGRRVIHIEYDTATNWSSRLPNANWLCILVSDRRERRYLDEVISKIIEKDVGWVATIGSQCELVHDLIDEEIAFRMADIEPLYLPKHNIMTTFHHDFSDGIWFSIVAADDDEFEIKSVVILDLTEGASDDKIQTVLNTIINKEAD